MIKYNCPYCGLIFETRIIHLPELQPQDFLNDRDLFLYPNTSPNGVYCPKCGDEECSFLTEEEFDDWMQEIENNKKVSE